MTVPDNAKLEDFKELLLNRCGLSFEKERAVTLAAGLHRRMTAQGIDDPDAYHALLNVNEAEFNRLVELLTVNETYFFREPDHLKLLIERIIPEIVEERKDGPVRIVSAGCSTGEEPYSIAIMLRERYGSEYGKLFSIVGVDIDANAIAKAKQGVFGKASFRGADSALIERYFEPTATGESLIRKEIRQDVEFEVVNLLGTIYPPAMNLPDIILYRNVSIYFPGQVQHRIFSRLAELLSEGGYLLVGATETIHHDLGILTLVEKDALFLYRKLPKIRIEDRRGQRRAGSASERHAAGAGSMAQPAPVSTHKQRAAIRHDQTTGIPARQRPLEPPVTAVVASDSHALFDDALEMAHNNRPDAALELLDTLNGRDGTFVKAHSLKGSILLSLSRFDEARDACKRALANDPLCLEASLMLGIIARHEENGEEALKRFREAIYLNASCWPAHFYTAELIYARGDRKRARSGYEATLRILENGSLDEHERAFFPLTFKSDQFLAICRHKLSLIKDHGK
jgi:chemotaxis protein methyltransferase CheR